jgi:hypothetical protein
MHDENEETRKRSIYMPRSLLDVVNEASAALDMGISDAMLELCRRGLLVGCPIRPAGQRTPLGLVVDDTGQVVTLYETAPLGEQIAAFQHKFQINSYSAVIRVLLFSGLYAYKEDMEKETPNVEG